MKLEQQLDTLLQIIALYELETPAHLRDAKLVAIREFLSRCQTTTSELETLVWQIVRRKNLSRYINPKRLTEFTFNFDAFFFKKLRSAIGAMNSPPLTYDEETDTFGAPSQVDFIAPRDCLWGLCYQELDYLYVKDSRIIKFDYHLAPQSLVRTPTITARFLSELPVLVSWTNLTEDLHNIENLNRISLEMSTAKAMRIFKSQNRVIRDRLLQGYQIYLELIGVDTMSI